MKKSDSHKSNVGIYLAGVGSFLLISAGTIGLAYHTVNTQLTDSHAQLQTTVEQAVATYSDAVTADALARAEEAAKRAEEAARLAEAAAQAAEDAAASNAVSSDQVVKLEVTIHDLIDFDDTKVSADSIEITDNHEVVYIVQKGDTLCKISAAFYVSVDELVKENHIINAHWIYTGEAIRIPTAVDLANME